MRQVSCLVDRVDYMSVCVTRTSRRVSFGLFGIRCQIRKRTGVGFAKNVAEGWIAVDAEFLTEDRIALSSGAIVIAPEQTDAFDNHLGDPPIWGSVALASF